MSVPDIYIDETVALNRKALYEEIWANSLTKAAKAHNMPIPKLREACIDAGIPLPSRRYWNTEPYLRRYMKAPLPESDEPEIVLHFRRKNPAYFEMYDKRKRNNKPMSPDVEAAAVENAQTPKPSVEYYQTAQNEGAAKEKQDKKKLDKHTEQVIRGIVNSHTASLEQSLSIALTKCAASNYAQGVARGKALCVMNLAEYFHIPFEMAKKILGVAEDSSVVIASPSDKP